MVKENLKTESEFKQAEKTKSSLLLKKAVSKGKKFLFKPSLPGRSAKVFRGQPAPETYTKEQHMLRSFFGGHNEEDALWGTGRDLPKIHNTLNKGYGLIKSGDRNRETAKIFGIGR